MAESPATNGTVFYDQRLSNGLQIVGQPMPDFESAAVSYYVRTGSRDEPDLSIAGVSHFLEHMVFKGTKTLDWQEITLEFNKIGAEINAFTSHESTVYYARVLGEYLERAVELLSDMMYPRLVESDFETEKEVIINEIARSEDQPYNLAFRRMMQTYFGAHPLGHRDQQQRAKQRAPEPTEPANDRCYGREDAPAVHDVSHVEAWLGLPHRNVADLHAGTEAVAARSRNADERRVRGRHVGRWCPSVGS